MKANDTKGFEMQKYLHGLSMKQGQNNKLE